MELKEENLIRIQSKGGLTGLALQKKQIIVSQLGERDTRFSINIDNLVNVFKVSNMLVGPALDSQGSIRAVIQLINKKHDGDIDDMDVSQLDSLLPAIGEILRAADDSLRVINISAGLNTHMHEIN
jgi:hypothetical protein